MKTVRSSTLAALFIFLFLGGFSNTTNANNGANDIPPEFQAAIERGAEYLVQLAEAKPNPLNGRKTIAAYALLKAGEDVSHPLVASALENTLKKTRTGGYVPYSKKEKIYEVGVDMMFLQAADEGEGEYRKDIEALSRYVIKMQESNGSWDYGTQSHEGEGDTSMMQYSLMGLLTAKKIGIEVPDEVWKKSAAWLIKWQSPDGGFAYHPLQVQESTHSMTVAGLCCLFIIKSQLFPDAPNKWASKDDGSSEITTYKSSENALFGVLESLSSKGSQAEQIEQQIAAQKAAKEEAEKRKAENPEEAEKLAEAEPDEQLKSLNNSIKRAMGWMNQRFSIAKSTPSGFRLYYLYTMERAAALGSIRKFSGTDWYTSGGNYILSTERRDGNQFDGWGGGHSGQLGGTSFAILFLSKATAQTFGKGGSARLGAGAMVGGRELKDPNAPDEEESEADKAKKEKTKKPIDELLVDLMNPKEANIAAVQQALVENVNFKDREGLIAQTDVLLRMAKDPRYEVRRTAYWALGRAEDYRVIPTLIDGLKEPDLELNVEALVSLCFLTRKPNGLSDQDKNPYKISGLINPTATIQEKAAVVKKWRQQTLNRWQKWYFSIRPYDERDDLDELILRNNESK